MWKLLFEISDRFFAIIPIKKWRDYLRVIVLFDYRRKLNALRKICPHFKWGNMRLAKGGDSLVFIIDNKITFKVRKRNNESMNFDRFEYEKRITDALRPYCTIQIPEIEFINSDGYTFYKNKFIPGKLLINISTRRIKKYQDKISHQLAEFIYKKSFANPHELDDLRGKPLTKNFSWNHGDMCSNILINPRTMVITGIIDWEWAGYGDIKNEFRGLVWVRKKMQKIGLDKSTKKYFDKIKNKSR